MLTAKEVIDQYFLETRCQLLEIAASLDRYDRAAGEGATNRPAADPRWENVFRSLEMLADRTAAPDRAERLLRLFSDPVD